MCVFEKRLAAQRGIEKVPLDPLTGRLALAASAALSFKN